MSERRSHWTDELIYEVFRIMDGYALEEHRGNRRHGTPTYDIIAAVEAWQDRTQQARAMSMTDNEAAIARVRALAEQASTVIARGCTCPGNDCTGKCRRGEPMGWDLDPADVLRALEGDSDEPAGP